MNCRCALALLLCLTATAGALQVPFDTAKHTDEATIDSQDYADTLNPLHDSLTFESKPRTFPSPTTFQPVHLSHSGLYLGSPLSRNAPPFISLYVDAPLYYIEDVKIHVTPVKWRNWEQVNLQCGPIDGGGIEACEKDDLHAEKRTELSSSLAKDGDCRAEKVIPNEARLLVSAKSCPPLASILQQHSAKNTQNAKATMLESVTLTFDVQRLAPVRREKHHFWLGRLHRTSNTSPDGGALWPFAGTAHAHNDSTTTTYTGLTPNRIDSLMQDPYIPRAGKSESFDPLNGVDLTFASWSNGIAIRVPSNGNETSTKKPKYEPVHAPVAGQIVWKGMYTIPRAPGNHRNDERGTGIMIRDEWGMVYQLLGLDEDAVYVALGQTVSAGQRIGGALRTPLSLEPPCRHKPADPPKMDDKSRRYPFRFRLLRVLVARPDASWTAWQEPYASGWQYFNPLDALTLAQRSNSVRPNSSPSQIFFAEPSDDGALQQPKILATSKDLIQPPIVQGETEVIVGFESFLDTPGTSDDQFAAVALHAIDYVIVPLSNAHQNNAQIADAEEQEEKELLECDQVPKDVYWRTAFEHTKLPNAWTLPLPKTNLLAHYVPAFTVGSVPLFKTRYASQYDEKARRLYYAPTRILVGQTDSRGAWDTRKEPMGNGEYLIWVRGRDWFGNEGCIGARMRIRNGP